MARRGVAAFGALLGHQVSDSVTSGLSKLGIAVDESSSRSLPDVSTLPARVREVFENAYGDATGHLFLVATPLAIIAFLLLLAIREVPLRTSLDTPDATSADGTDGGRAPPGPPRTRRRTSPPRSVPSTVPTRRRPPGRRRRHSRRPLR